MSNSIRLNARHISTHAAMQSKSKNHDATILIAFGFGLIGLAVTAYSLAVGFGIERQIMELLTFMP